MIKHIFSIIFGLFLFCLFCTGKNDQIPSAILSGSIKNADNKNLMIDDHDVLIKKDGSFEYHFELDTPTYLLFSLNEETLLFLEPGDSLHLTLDADQFLDTISFCYAPISWPMDRVVVHNEIFLHSPKSSLQRKSLEGLTTRPFGGVIMRPCCVDHRAKKFNVSAGGEIP